MRSAYSITNANVGRIRALHSDIVETHPTIIYPHAEPMFPPTNLRLYKPGKVCRFKYKDHAQIVIDRTTDSPVDMVAILNHNLLDTAIVRIGHATTIDGQYSWHYLTASAGNSFWRQLPSIQARHWRLIIEWVNNSTTVGNNPVELGELWLGKMELLPPFTWGLQESVEHVDAFDESEYGVPSAHFLSRKRTFRGSFPVLKGEEAVEVMNFFKSVQGRVRPFLFIPDVSNNFDVILGRFRDQVLSKSHVFPGHVEGLEFNFQEDPWGKTGV